VESAAHRGGLVPVASVVRVPHRRGRRVGREEEWHAVAERELPNQSQNPVKDPDEWTTGDEPMTGPQASYLKTLLQQAGREGDFEPTLTKAEASRLIDQLQEETGRGAGNRSNT
jgi:hypothetical protein